MSDIVFARVASSTVQDGEVFLTVQPPRPGVSYRDIPMLQLFPGAMIVPEEDAVVAVHKMPDGKRVATLAISVPEELTMPDLEPGDMVFKFSDGTQIQVAKDGSGTYNVNIDADGSVFINGIDFEQHTHDYEDATINDTSEGTGSPSDSTRTTEPPNSP